MPMELRTRELSLWSVLTLAVAARGALAAEIPAMPSLRTFHTEVPVVRNRAPTCVIAVPPGAAYAGLGAKIAGAVRERTGVDIPVVSAEGVPVDTLGTSNTILLGYFANNPLIERLYDEFYVGLSTDWPGRGGYVVRTVHDPLGKGTSSVVLGGADAESVAKAVDDFVVALPAGEGELSFPHTLRVVRPDGSLSFVRDPDGVRGRIAAAEGKNFRAVASLLTRAGMSYRRTGNPDDVEVFRGVAPILLAVIRKLGKLDDMRGAIELINVWDTVEEAPGFSPDDRAAITELMWELTHRFTFFGRTAEDASTPAGNNWNSRVACDLGRYWHKYYGLDVGGLRTWTGVTFKSKAKFWRSKEDCPGYGGHTIHDTVHYVLSHQYDEYWRNGTGRKAADYGVAVINNLGGIAGFGDTSSMGSSGDWPALFRAAAWKLRDGRYLYALGHANPGGGRCFMQNSYLQNELKPEKPDDLMGVHVVPLPDWVYEHRTSVLGTAPSQMNPVLDADPVPPRDECFDKITFRTSMEPQDQYLILGGISHGYHAHPDGNAIIELTDNGRYCLFDSGYFVPDTVEHNTLVVYRDGLFEPIPRLTGLAALGDFPGIGMTQTYLSGYNGVNWRRNILWLKEQYFLVIDEVEAELAGAFGMNAVFRTLSDEKPEIGADRLRAVHKGAPFSIISASCPRLKLTSTTPPAGNRYALVESKTAEMGPGDREYFINLLYSPRGERDWPHDVVPAGEGAVMIKSPDGYAFAGTGKRRPIPRMEVEAALFHVSAGGFTLTAGQKLSAGVPWFAADRPVNIQVRLGGAQATGVVESREEVTVRLHAREDTVRLDGQPQGVSAGPDGLEFAVSAGKHTLAFQPMAGRIELVSASAFDQLARTHAERLAGLGQSKQRDDGKTRAEWRVETARTEVRTVFVGSAGTEVKNLTRAGTPKCWTEAQRGARPRAAVDGSADTYTATSSGLPWTSNLPKDLGMEWPRAVTVGCFEIDYYDAGYAPTMAGQQLQAWDGGDWCAIEAEISKDQSGAAWTYTFEPVKTARLRVLITEFSPSRTAVREMRIFPEPASARQREVRKPCRTNGLAALDVDGDGKEEVLAVVGDRVKCINSEGTVLWERDLDTVALCVDAYDLDSDGKGEVIVGGRDHKLYCFDSEGGELWSVVTPADPFTPDREPMRGEVKVVRCADVDGDGDGEIVLGSGNWFAYGYDHEGKLLWTALNWAHQPTSIAFAQVGDGKLGALIGTTYCAANLFGHDGKKIGSVDVGYHGAAMSTAAGDMDGNGKPELIAGSRVGGFHCNELGTDRSWTGFMGAEVSRVALVDLDGDGTLELLAGSKNAHVLAVDAAGDVIWARNVEEAVLDMTTADVSGDGRPEIVVATEGGMVRVLDVSGAILSTFRAADNVTRVVAADLKGDGRRRIVAGCDDGFVYGCIE